MQNYLNDEEKKAAVVEQPNQEQQAAKPVGIREDEGTVENGVLTVAPTFSGSQVRDIAKRYKDATQNAGDYYMHDGVQYPYADLYEPVQKKPVQQDAKPVAATEVKPAQQVSQQTTKPEQAQKANVNAAQKIGSAVGGFFDTVGDYVGGITDNIRAKKAQKNQEAREAPAKQEQAPIKHDDQKPHIDDVGLVDSQLKESAIHAKTESDFSASYFAAHKLDEEDGGIIVDGTFVADDNLDAMTAWKKATEYYRAQHGKNSEYKENYQYKGKLLPAGYKEEESKQLRPGSLEQPIADDQLSEYYEAIKARDEAAERDLPDDYIPMNIRERTAQASSETQTKQAEAPASAQVAKPEEKAAKKTEEKSEVKAEDQAQVAAKAVETPEGSQAKPAINAPASNAPAAAAPVAKSTQPSKVTETPVKTVSPAPASTVSQPASTAPAEPAPTTTEVTEEEESNAYEKARTAIEEAYAAKTKAVEDAYQEENGGYETLVKEAEKKRAELAKADEKTKRREESNRYIAGVGDLISSFANLMGTAKGASNQDQNYTASKYVTKAEQARKARNLEMKDLNKRLDEMRLKQKTLKATKDRKLGELAGDKAKSIAELYAKEAVGENKYAIEQLKGSIRLEIAENKIKQKIASDALKITNTANKGVRNATFYDASGKAILLNVANVEDPEAEVIKAVNAAESQWTAEEKEQFTKALKAASNSTANGGDGGKKLELFYVQMAAKPYVYEHFKKLVGANKTSVAATKEAISF